MRTTLLAAALLACGSSFGQSSWNLGVSAGAFVYQGDLAPSAFGSYRTLRPNLTVWGSRALTDRLSIRASVAMGSLSGDDAAYSAPVWRPERALRFSSSLTEISAQAVWDVGGGRWRVQPYVFAGVGYAFVNVQRDASAFNAAYFGSDKTAEGLAIDRNRTPPRSLPVVPVGAGLRYPITDRLSLHAETNYRLSHTDYLDGFSQAGNPSLYDHYQSWTIGVSWGFDGVKGLFAGGGKTGCPSVQ